MGGTARVERFWAGIKYHKCDLTKRMQMGVISEKRKEKSRNETSGKEKGNQKKKGGNLPPRFLHYVP